MFAFVPRKVAQHAKISSSAAEVQARTGITSTNLISTNQDCVPDIAPEPYTANAKGKVKEVEGFVSQEDYVILVSLSLSDYAIWSNPELRRTIASCEDAYIPLSYLLHHSPFLSGLDPLPAEIALVKSVRTHASSNLDVRMLVSAPCSAWRDNKELPMGGYEVRRKDWNAALTQSRSYTRHEWESRTIYMENIPPQHRTISKIYRFTCSLLEGSPSSSRLIQNIWLPPHHLDKPGDQPKCKGFVLVTFAETVNVETLLTQWPWYPRRANTVNVDHLREAHEAVKFGFRTLSKARWDQLKEEYLVYRQRLLDQITRAETAEEIETAEDLGTQSIMQSSSATNGFIQVQPALPDAVDLSSLYPPSCLVLVRNVHPETNKTTLRTLFSQAFQTFPQEQRVNEDALDYVDFNKGIDSCYLRLASSMHARHLVAFFSNNPKVQSEGLDSIGIVTLNKGKPIAMEIVEGTREELYWNKVPQKVRRRAVEKAAAQSTPRGGPEFRAQAEAGDTFNFNEGNRRRRRRKHDS
ncbi:hypothetical protein AcW1_005034 [Taiwanofungus camphoratus]|nr:hypothetical protein AcW2_005957 [Antrodia cinnamomea]KAI0960551.1 hypothetical protein AcW1_005034 [Antrodia cinnamomea]